MEDIDAGWIAFLSAMAGALIGGGATLVSTWIQARSQRRRDLVKVAYDAAIADYQHTWELAQKAMSEGKFVEMVPLLSFVYHHAGVIALVEREKLSPESVRKLMQQQSEISKVLRDITPTPAGWSS